MSAICNKCGQTAAYCTCPRQHAALSTVASVAVAALMAALFVGACDHDETARWPTAPAETVAVPTPEVTR